MVVHEWFLTRERISKEISSILEGEPFNFWLAVGDRHLEKDFGMGNFQRSKLWYILGKKYGKVGVDVLGRLETVEDYADCFAEVYLFRENAVKRGVALGQI